MEPKIRFPRKDRQIMLCEVDFSDVMWLVPKSGRLANSSLEVRVEVTMGLTGCRSGSDEIFVYHTDKGSKSGAGHSLGIENSICRIDQRLNKSRHSGVRGDFFVG